MPHSTVTVQTGPQTVQVDLSVPVSELSAAQGVADDKVLAGLARYLSEHVGVVGSDDRPWTMTLDRQRVGLADGDRPALLVALTFAPQPGAAPRAAALRYDVVNHRVASHYALVYRRLDTALVPLGRLQAPATTLSLP